MTQETVTLALRWDGDKLYLGQLSFGSVFQGASTKKWWVSALVGPATGHDTREAAKAALVEAVRGMGADPEAEISAERLAMIDAIVNGGTALERFQRHTGVTTFSDLKEWAERQLRGVLMMRGRRDGPDAPRDDELGDYLVGKQAALEPMLANMRQIVERSHEAADAARFRWQPIETAETDGTAVQLWTGHYQHTGWYNDSLPGWCALADDVELVPSPTHWMFLPEPPDASTAREAGDVE